jgi:glycosyltransferase involved in cell wall biosynthesis
VLGGGKKSEIIMKIAYLLGSLNRGGTETLLLDVFRNAGKNGLKVIGIYRKSGVLENEFATSGVFMQRIDNKRNILSYILKLRKLLLSEKVDVVHAQQPIDAFYAYVACRGLKIKVVLTLHGYDFTDQTLGSLILQFIIRRTDFNIYVSDTQRQYYQLKYRLNPAKQLVVYNGISFDKFDTLYNRSAALSRATDNTESLRNELKLSTETLLLGTVGNFNDVRDQMTICKFLKLLYEQQVDFHFVFVGKRVESSAGLYDKCVEYCSENRLMQRVSFLGMRNDVPRILNELDGFIYSTNHDTFGIAVVEAMAVGVPVFVNDWGVMQEITGHGKYATLYKTKDDTDLLREFMLFLQNKSDYQKKAKDAADFVRKQYSIKVHIMQLTEIYNLK